MGIQRAFMVVEFDEEAKSAEVHCYGELGEAMNIADKMSEIFCSEAAMEAAMWVLVTEGKAVKIEKGGESDVAAD